MVTAAICFWKNYKNKDVEMKNRFEPSTVPKRLSYRELARSTRNFAQTEKLGEGGHGEVYKAFLKDQKTYVAVKRVSVKSSKGVKEFARQAKIISLLRHRNLVQLVDWCHEKEKHLLVYKFMEKGSLDLHLFAVNSLLPWSTRYKIARGLASALVYLHEEWEDCILHTDIKSSNVMLDSDFNTKLGDFGFGKLVDYDNSLDRTTVFAGYMAPECAVTAKPSKETDVFSFGVVALEIACGRKAIKPECQGNQINLVQWVSDLYRTRTLLEAVDKRLGLDYSEEEIMRLMIVGLCCVQPKPDHRPSMGEVSKVLNNEAPLPQLHSLMLAMTPVSSKLLTS